MFAKTLIKLIDYAIFPAILIVAAKILGIIFLAHYFGSDFQFNNFKIIVTNPEEFIAINSYSSLIMFGAVIAGLAWVVFKAHAFHETHIAPTLSSKLFSMNMEDLIHTTETIFSQAFVWLSYTWISTVIFGVHAYYGLLYWWIFWVALAVSVLSTALLAVDMEREIKADKETIEENNGPYKRMVKFEELAEEILR